MAKVFIDGVEYDLKAGQNLLEAALGAGLDLPYFCWHPAMGSIGSCRQCAVVQYQNEDDKRGKIVMGCMTPVTDGARFSMHAENAAQFRESIIESLMTHHPHDCPVCAEGGECHLQDMTVMVGHRDRKYRGLKRTHRNQYLGPLIHHEMNRCITCYRCVRFYRDYAGGEDLAALASRDHTYFGRHQDGVLQNEFSGNLVEVCPTGVFTDKTLLKQYTRKWDLQSAPSVCHGCAVGCNIIPGERYGKLKRVHNRFNHEVNGYFLCDRGRFGNGYVNSEKRLNFAGQRSGDGSFRAIKRNTAIELAAGWMYGRNVAAVGSPRASVESNWLLKNLVGAKNFYSGFSAAEGATIQRALTILKASHALSPSVRQMESADAILVLGEDITHTAPRVALALRQAVRNRALQLADAAKLFHWQDAAVRNLAQDQRSPMIIVSATETRLDDVASELISLPPADIAGFAQSVVQHLLGNSVEDQRAAQVTEVLKGAKRPLVISGSSMLHGGILDGAGAIAEALESAGAEAMLSFCLPEANSLGLAMLGGNPLSDLMERVDEIDTLIVLENDLSRRLDTAQFELLRQSVDKIVSLDLLENTTLDNSDLVLPSASFVESEGTLVSSEGRAQRFYPVFEPLEERLPSWRWLLLLAEACGSSDLRKLKHFDDVEQACAADVPMFARLSEEAPGAAYRSHGMKIPRQTHRYSGRTAMHADVSVHEPQQPADEETPLAYSMEGLNRDEPAALMPYFWSPGFNSNQSVTRFQQEVGGELRGGPCGVRLVESGMSGIALPEPAEDKTVPMEAHKWHLVPFYRLHGSDELSANTDEIAELAGSAEIAIGEIVAQHHRVTDGDGLLVGINGHRVSLQVRVLKRVAKNCAGFSVGFAETLDFRAGELVTLEKDPDWVRPVPQVIASDRGRHA